MNEETPKENKAEQKSAKDTTAKPQQSQKLPKVNVPEGCESRVTNVIKLPIGQRVDF